MGKQINKLPKNWSDDDLVMWAKGEVTVGKDITDEAVAEEAFNRMEMEQGSVEDAKSAIIDVAVEINEPTAPVKEPEVAKKNPDPEPAVKEEPDPKPAAKPEPTTEGAKTATMMAIEDNLAQYKAKMMPGVAHVGNDGPTAQVKLYRTIQTILRLEGSEFNRTFGNLLKFVAEHRNSLFDERYSYRYFDALSLTNPERRNFERILNLIITTCDPAKRSLTIKQVDIDATMEGFKNSDIHQKVIAFYSNV